MRSDRNKRRWNRTLAGSLAALGMILTLGAPAHAWRYNEAEQDSILTIDPLVLVNGRLSLAYESAMSARSSFVLGVNALLFEPPIHLSDTDYGDTDLYGIGPEIALHFFLTGAAPGGVYVGPFAELQYLWAEDGDLDRFGYTVGAEVGINYITANAFVFGAGVGLGYEDMRVEGDDWIGDEGFALRLHLKFGVAF